MQATWPSPQEHAPDAPPCPHIAPSRPRHLPEYLCIYDAVCSAGLPNFLRARISLQHNLHIKAWRHYAPFYNDHELPDYLECGFPLGYMLGNMTTPSQSNHQSACCYPSHVDHYITTELDAFAFCGRFPKPPFDAFQINPLMTAPNKHSDMRRVILDLSHPDGASVNSGIPRDSYLGVPYKLSLPSAQDLRDLIIAEGQGCHLWSIDLQSDYRQLRVCPMGLAPAWYCMGWRLLFRHSGALWHPLGRYVHAKDHLRSNHSRTTAPHPLHRVYGRCGFRTAAKPGPKWQTLFPSLTSRARLGGKCVKWIRAVHAHDLAWHGLWFRGDDNGSSGWQNTRMSANVPALGE